MHTESSRQRKLRTRRPPAAGKRSVPTILIRALVGLALVAGVGLASAQEEFVEPVMIIGKIAGGQTLLNPSWVESKDPKNHRFTFRVPSTTVSAGAKRLTSYLPKELCIAALAEGKVEAQKAPVPMHVSGGRTTPVTLVVTQGQEIQIENHDPFPHRIYTTGEGDKGLTPNDIEPTKSRRWTPPGPGKYEIRDELSPSLRSWIVVEPKAAKIGFPNFKNEFRLDLKPGVYTLRGYHNGEPVGKPLPITVKPLPKQQRLPAPLVVGQKKKTAKKKG